MREIQVPTGYLLSSVLDWIQLSCWFKKPHRNPETAQAVAKTVNFSPQSDYKSPLLKITLIQLIEHGEEELMPT